MKVTCPRSVGQLGSEPRSHDPHILQPSFLTPVYHPAIEYKIFWPTLSSSLGVGRMSPLPPAWGSREAPFPPSDPGPAPELLCDPGKSLTTPDLGSPVSGAELMPAFFCLSPQCGTPARPVQPQPLRHQGGMAAPAFGPEPRPGGEVQDRVRLGKGR